MKTQYEKCPILQPYSSTPFSLDSVEVAKHEAQFQDTLRKSILPPETPLKQYYEKWAIVVSVASFIISLILSMAGLICTIVRSSPSTAAFSADCFLDALSSIIVILKYWMSLKGQILEEAKACIYLGALFITSSLDVIIKATTDIAIQPEVEESDNIAGLTYLSLASAIAFILLSGAKYWLYKKLNDDSLILDAINTLFSGIFAIAIGITAQVMLNSPHLWYLDATESMVFAFLLGLYGIKVIVENVSHYKAGKEFEKLECAGDNNEKQNNERSKLLKVVSDKTYKTYFHKKSYGSVIELP